jgi:hypothetical protein
LSRNGAGAEEIEKDPAKFGYSSAMTEAAKVRCPQLIINGRNDDNSPVPVIDRPSAKAIRGQNPEVTAPHGGHLLVSGESASFRPGLASVFSLPGGLPGRGAGAPAAGS